MTIDNYLKIRCREIESHLDQLIPERKVPHKSLYEAARYSLFSSGKRIRPILTLATAETLGTPIHNALTPACAIEMIHTYSLIHDDLPCMDDDDFRRGKPSLHKTFPESHAVLAGDFLLTHAFQVVSQSPHLTPETKSQIISLLGERAGGEGMIGGQILDIESKNMDKDKLKLIHDKKTGAMITASIEIGAIVAGASKKTCERLTEFGNAIGLAFQIIDDILDSAESESKSTYVTLFGIEKSKEIAKELQSYTQLILNDLDYDTTKLAMLADHIVDRNF